MKIRFYFDYSDYRSYLMMHAISAIRDLPIQLQWIALDAYSLRALTGCEPPCTRQRDFMKQEALRYSRREGIEFIWQNEKFHNGSALRVGIWLMTHAPERFESYSRQILELIWRKGQMIDAAVLRNILQTLDLSFDEIFRTSSERDNFQFQDACLQEALADGLFDIPAFVIGQNILCHFDQANELRRLALIECLKSVPPETMASALAAEMLSLPRDVFKLHLNAILKQPEIQAAEASYPDIETPPGPIHHSLTSPEAIWKLPKSPLSTPLNIHICQAPDIHTAIQNAKPDALSLWQCREIPAWDNEQPLPAASPANICFLARVKYHGQIQRICLLSDKQGKLSCLPESLENKSIFSTLYQRWNIAVLSANAARDPNMARIAALKGAHIILCDDICSPAANAFVCLSSAPVLAVENTSVTLFTTNSGIIPLSPETDYQLQPQFDIRPAELWPAPAPRTILLFEKPLTLGERSDDADLELSCRGMNLIVNTAQQSSELSATRVFEKLRIQSDTFLLLPLNNDQIFITELISHRLIQTLNQAPRDAIPLFVNYWSEFEFEMLEMMRPVFATLVSTFRIPIILVVGNQIVEIWLSTPQGIAWRVEKDDDCYTLDIAELLRTERCFQQILSSLQIQESTFLDRIQMFESAPDNRISTFAF